MKNDIPWFNRGSKLLNWECWYAQTRPRIEIKLTTISLEIFVHKNIHVLKFCANKFLWVPHKKIEHDF